MADKMKYEPKLRLSYTGSSGAIEEISISAKAAAKRWPELFRQLQLDVVRAAQRLDAQQEQLPGLEYEDAK